MLYFFVFVVFLLILLLIFNYTQYHHVFKPSYYRDLYLGDEYEMIYIKRDDGVELEGVVYEPKDLYRHLPTIESTLLFFGGNYQDVVGMIDKLSQSYKHVRIVSFNYRSFGKSGGKPSEKKIFEDGVEIAKYVKENYGEFYILGYSLGSSVASYVASKMDVKALFLVGSFDSYYSVAKSKYKIIDKMSKINLEKLFRYKFNNVEHVKDVDAKTYIFASTSDEILNIKHTRNLKECVSNLHMYEELDNLTHKDLLWDSKVIETIKGVMK